MSSDISRPKRRTVAHVYRDLSSWLKETKPTVLPSETALAQQLNTSRVTLRSALAQLVKDGTLSKMPSRGYLFQEEPHASSQASSPSENSKKIYTIGMPIWATSWGAFDFLQSPYSAMMLRLLHSHAEAAGHRLLPLPCGLSDCPIPEAMETLINTSDVIISLAPEENVDLPSLFGNAFKKTILLDYGQGVQNNRFSPDLYRGFSLAFEKLYQGGCREILVTMENEKTIPPRFIRIAGIESAVAQYSDASVRFIGDGFQSEDAYAHLAREIRSGQSFDGILCVSDPAAVGALQACRDYQLDVPGKIQVVGFGNFPSYRFFTPRLSTVDCHWSELAREAVKGALSLASGTVSQLPARDFPVTWVEGETTLRAVSEPLANSELPPAHLERIEVQ